MLLQGGEDWLSDTFQRHLSAAGEDKSCGHREWEMMSELQVVPDAAESAQDPLRPVWKEDLCSEGLLAGEHTLTPQGKSSSLEQPHFVTGFRMDHAELVARGECCTPRFWDGTEEEWFGKSSEHSKHCSVGKRVILMEVTELQGVKTEKQQL